MRRSRRKMEVDTFPFLAVLLCAMGALILLLMVIDRRSKIVAQNKAYENYLAQKRNRDTQTAEREEARRLAEEAERSKWQAKKAELTRKLQTEHDDLEKQRAAILADIADLDAKMRDRTAAEQSLERKLADTRVAVKVTQAELDAKQSEVERARAEQQGHRRLREELSQELFRLEAALRTLAERKRSEKPVFSLVPYTGKQGSNRKPIYVELDRDGAIFYPERERLSENGWSAADFRRLVQERTGNLVAEEKKPSFDAKPPSEGPYLLFLVRPDGIDAYYAVLDALRGYRVDFGYELVEPDWKFDFAEERVDALPWRKTSPLDVAPSHVTRPPPKTVSKNWRGPGVEGPGETTFRPMAKSGGNGGGYPGGIPISPAPGATGFGPPGGSATASFGTGTGGPVAGGTVPVVPFKAGSGPPGLGFGGSVSGGGNGPYAQGNGGLGGPYPSIPGATGNSVSGVPGSFSPGNGVSEVRRPGTANGLPSGPGSSGVPGSINSGVGGGTGSGPGGPYAMGVANGIPPPPGYSGVPGAINGSGVAGGTGSGPGGPYAMGVANGFPPPPGATGVTGAINGSGVAGGTGSGPGGPYAMGAANGIPPPPGYSGVPGAINGSGVAGGTGSGPGGPYAMGAANGIPPPPGATGVPGANNGSGTGPGGQYATAPNGFPSNPGTSGSMNGTGAGAGAPGSGGPYATPPNGAVPNGPGTGSASGLPGTIVVNPNANVPFTMPTDIGGTKVPPAPTPPPSNTIPPIPPPPSLAALAPTIEPIDPAAQIAAAQANPSTSPSRPLGSGGRAGQAGDDGGEPSLPGMMPLPAPRERRPVTPRPPSVGKLLGNRDFILTIDVVDRGAILTPPGRAFDFSDPAAVGQVVAALRKIADARQATVRPGETPYRVLVRFRVAGDGRRNYYTLYPAVSELGYPMSRESLE